MTSCYPWFHAKFAPLLATPFAKQYLVSGCKVDPLGNVPCSPEAMRAKAETKMRELGLLSSVSLATYTLARYMQGEVGSGTIEERVAVGEAAYNRGKGSAQGVVNLLLYRQPAGHPNRGWYGPIHGGGVTSAPYGRWATTSADPTVLTLLLADLVMSGTTQFTGGANDQDGMEYISAFPSVEAKVRYEAKLGKFWVGPLPGVDHWHTWLWYSPGVKADSPMGVALIQRALDEAGRCQGTLPGNKRCANRPVWPADLPICGKPFMLPGGDTLRSLAPLLGLLFGGYWFTRRGRVGEGR
jgi:hypothetical protein